MGGRKRAGKGGKWEFYEGRNHLLSVKILSKTRTRNVFYFLESKDYTTK